MFRRNRINRNTSWNPTSGDWLFKLVPIFIVFVFCLILCYWIFLGFVAYEGVTHIQSGGLSGLLHSLWCGSKPNCQLPAFLR